MRREMIAMPFDLGFHIFETCSARPTINQAGKNLACESSMTVKRRKINIPKPLKIRAVKLFAKKSKKIVSFFERIAGRGRLNLCS